MNHDIFGWALENRFKIRGKCKSLIMSFISKVQIRNCLSADKIFDFDVPKCSILGPLLFTMYITPISDPMKQIRLSYQEYADDTLILSSLRQQTLDDDIRDLSTKLSLLFQAFSQIKFRINPDKTEIILISSRNQKLNLSKLELEGETLKFKLNIKSLGITIEKHLSFRRHRNSVTSSCYNEFRKLCKIRHHLTIETRINVQNLISRLDYCNSVLSGVPKTEILKF